MILESPKHLPITWGFSDRKNPVPQGDIKTPSQVHGNRITEYQSNCNLADTDGIFTTEPGIKIAVRVADCAPVLLGGQLRNGKLFIAAVHAGWRGATKNVWGNMIDRFIDCGGDLKTAAWAIGPCILKCHFQVGNEVFKAAELHKHWSEAKGINNNPKDYFDLPEFLSLQALDKGLDKKLNFSQLACTYCNSQRFYSYRRGDLTKRQYGWIKIE
ncbi:MAG: polyphenol oxidase family protein [Holophagaceae bacterium]